MSRLRRWGVRHFYPPTVASDSSKCRERSGSAEIRKALCQVLFLKLAAIWMDNTQL